MPFSVESVNRLVMKMKFELLYGYRHCHTENVYSGGYVDTEEEAIQWVETRRRGEVDTPRPSDEESNRCPVSYCPLKNQKPWFSYKRVHEE